MIDTDRLAELDTMRLDADTPPDARISLPAADLRDLVQLIPIVRAAIELRNAVRDAVVTNRAVMRAAKRFDGERAGVLSDD